jgi:hypothetical protein
MRLEKVLLHNVAAHNVKRHKSSALLQITGQHLNVTIRKMLQNVTVTKRKNVNS